MNQHFPKENDASLRSSYLVGTQAEMLAASLPVNLPRFFTDSERSCAFACDCKILLQSFQVYNTTGLVCYSKLAAKWYEKTPAL